MASKLPTLDNSNDLLYIKKVVQGEEKCCGYKREYLARNLSTMEQGFIVCNVCTGLMREPTLDKGVTTCLMCSENSDKINEVNVVQDSVMALEIKCPLLRDCKWSGKLSEAERHLNTCVAFLIECADCEQIFPRRELLSHKSELCPMRETICKYGCKKSGHFEDLGKHEQFCTKIPILCQNGCGMEFPRKDLAEHKNVCELEAITCPYTEYGCNAKPILRRDLLSHKKENIVEHTDMSLNTIKQLKKEKSLIELKIMSMKQLDGVEWEFQYNDMSLNNLIEGPTFYVNNYKLKLLIPRRTSLFRYFSGGIRFSIKRIPGEFDKQLGIVFITHYRVIIVDRQDYSNSHYEEGRMNYKLKIGESSEEFYRNDTCVRYLTADDCISVRLYFDINTQPPFRTVPKDNATGPKTSDEDDPFD